MNLPNKLTVLRVILVPFFVALLLISAIAACICRRVDYRCAGRKYRKKAEPGHYLWEIFRPACRQGSGIVRLDLLYCAWGMQPGCGDYCGSPRVFGAAAGCRCGMNGYCGEHIREGKNSGADGIDCRDPAAVCRRPVGCL